MNHKSRLLAIALMLAILIASMGTFSDAALADQMRAVVIVDSMEVRDEDGAVLGSLKKGTEVTVHAYKNGIARITYNGKKGLARLSDLKKVEQAATAAPAQPTTAATKPATEKPTTAPTAVPRGTYATIASDNVSVYKSPSSSAAILGTFDTGDTVEVIETRGSWAQIVKNGDTAYILKKHLASPSATQPALPTAAPQATAASEKYPTISQGQRGSHVAKLQKQLEALGFFDGDPAGNYLSLTTASVKRFQSAAGIPATGTADSLTQTALYSKKAPKSDILSKSYKKGDSGSDVERIQQRLKTKGYYVGALDGTYGANLEAALLAYQDVNGGSKTGQADTQTLRHLFSSKAASKPASYSVPVPEATPTPTQAPTVKPTEKPASGEGSASTTEAAEPAAPSSSKADTVISTAKSHLGKPYIYGNSGPNSFDCSGLTVHAYGKVGVSLPRTAYQQGYNLSGTKLTKSQLKRGDLVFFDTLADSDLSDHVGIYIGDNQFIHASSGQRKVVISSLTGYYLRVFSWGKRVL